MQAEVAASPEEGAFLLVLSDAQWPCSGAQRVVLGRDTSSTRETMRRSPGTFVPVGKAKNISRAHAAIEWNASEQRFELAVTGKNGLYLDGVHMPKSDARVPLRDRARMDVEATTVYFVLPQEGSG